MCDAQRAVAEAVHHLVSQGCVVGSSKDTDGETAIQLHHCAEFYKTEYTLWKYRLLTTIAYGVPSPGYLGRAFPVLDIVSVNYVQYQCTVNHASR